MPNYFKIFVFIVIGCILYAHSSPIWSAELPTHTNASTVQKRIFQTKPLSHPRLLISKEDIPRLQLQSQSSHQEIWDAIQQFVTIEEGVVAPLSSPADGGLSTYRNFGNQLVPLSFSCVITEQNDVCNSAKKLLMTYADWSQWGNEDQRDLALAHMMIGNALAYDWLFDHLNADEQKIVRINLTAWAEKMYQASSGDKVDDWNNWWRKSYAQNHHWTNNSALGIVGLALLDEDPRAQIWLEQAVEQLEKTQTMLNGVADGSWHEGIHYQDYGLTMVIPFWLSLREITGINLIPEDYMQNYVTWRLYNFLPGEWLPILQFGDVEEDWESGYRSYSVLRFAATEYQDGVAEWLTQRMQESVGRPASVWTASWYVFEYLYYNPTIKATYPLSLNKSETFPDIQSVIWRTGWQKGATVFGLKADGYAGRFLYDSFTQEQELWETPCSDSGCELNFGHDHDDALTFYLYHNGVRMIPEVIGNLARDSALHNTLLIDGAGQYRPPDNRYRYPEELARTNSNLVVTANTPDFDYLVADATRRYQHVEGIENVSRRVFFAHSGYLVMVDNLAASQAHQYTWTSHFADEINIDSDWVWSESASEDRMGVQAMSSDVAITAFNEDAIPYVQVSTQEAVESTRFVHLLYPTSSSGWEERPQASLLDDTGTAVVVQIQSNDSRNYLDQLLVRYDDSAGYVSSNGLATNAGTAFIRRDSAGVLRQIFIHGGSFLQDVNAEGVLVENFEDESALEVEFVGTIMRISGNVNSDMRLYAPNAKYVYVNGAGRDFEHIGDYIQIQS